MEPGVTQASVRQRMAWSGLSFGLMGEMSVLVGLSLDWV